MARRRGKSESELELEAFLSHGKEEGETDPGIIGKFMADKSQSDEKQDLGSAFPELSDVPVAPTPEPDEVKAVEQPEPVEKIPQEQIEAERAILRAVINEMRGSNEARKREFVGAYNLSFGRLNTEYEKPEDRKMWEEYKTGSAEINRILQEVQGGKGSEKGYFKKEQLDEMRAALASLDARMRKAGNREIEEELARYRRAIQGLINNNAKTAEPDVLGLALWEKYKLDPSGIIRTGTREKKDFPTTKSWDAFFIRLSERTVSDVELKKRAQEVTAVVASMREEDFIKSPDLSAAERARFMNLRDMWAGMSNKIANNLIPRDSGIASWKEFQEHRKQLSNADAIRKMVKDNKVEVEKPKDLRAVYEAAKLELLSRPLTPEEFQKMGKKAPTKYEEILMNLKREKPEESPIPPTEKPVERPRTEWDDLFGLPKAMISLLDRDEMEAKVLDIQQFLQRSIVSGLEARTPEQLHEDMECSEKVRRNVHNRTRPSSEGIEQWNEIVTLYEKHRNDVEPVILPEPIVPVKPEPVPMPPSPEQAVYPDPILNKLHSIGVTVEMLKTIPEFAEIAGSEGKMEWVLGKLEQIKLQKIRDEAVYEAEGKYRGELRGKFFRMMTRSGRIKKEELRLARKPFDMDTYREDIAGLVHFANVAPDMEVVERNGERHVVVDYLNNIGIPKNELLPFNEAATAYANLPHEKEWSKYPKEKREEYEAIKKVYDDRFNEVLKEIPKSFKPVTALGEKHHESHIYTVKDAYRIMNTVEFEVKAHQTLNNYPQAELELKKLAETKGWKKQWEVAKAQLGIGAASAATGGIMGGGLGLAVNSALLRTGVRSSLVLSGAAAAAPLVLALSALGLGGFIGWQRGGMKAEEQLKREEELMRFGAEVEKRGTNLNFIKAEDVIGKIGHLRELIGFNFDQYKAYMEAHGAKPLVSDENFETKKLQWAEQLEVRIEYVWKKLDENKISFDKDDAIAGRYELIKEVGDAVAAVAVLPRYGTDVTNANGEHISTTGKTRRGQLTKVLDRAESRIKENQEQFVVGQKRKGAILGMTFGGAGFLAGLGLHEAFGSSVSEAVAEKAQHIKGVNFKEGQGLQKAVDIMTEEQVAAKVRETLIETPSAPQIDETKFIVHPKPDAATPSSVEVSPESQQFMLDEDVAEAPIAEPYTHTFANEGQSREYALARFFEERKGMDAPEAVREAHKIAQTWGPRGERSLPFVHKDQSVVFSEEDGKIVFEDVPKDASAESLPKSEAREKITIRDNQTDEFTNKIIKTDSAERAVTRALRLNAEEYGFKGDVEDKAAIKEWADKMTKDVIKQNPSLRSVVTQNGDQLELARTANGGWYGKVERGIIEKSPAPDVPTKPAFRMAPSSVPSDLPVGGSADTMSSESQLLAPTDNNETSEMLESYEARGANNLSRFIENVSAREPRFNDLSVKDQDKFLSALLVRVLESASNTENPSHFFAQMGIKSGNPFNLKGDFINLSRVIDKKGLDGLFADVSSGKVPDKIAYFAEEFEKNSSALRKLKPAELSTELKDILASLKSE